MTNLLELPDCVLDDIFHYLSYDEIAKKRLVSTKINTICQSLLNRGVIKLRSLLHKEIETLKPLLPRKQSERWNHTADKKIRYLESIEANVRLLSYTYEKYIKTNLCCFIPGKVIDMSLYMLKRVLDSQPWLSNAHSVELTDEICMAKEHFQKQIEPALRKLKLKGQKHVSLGLFSNIFDSFLPARINPTAEPSLQKATKTAVAPPMDIEHNSKKCQFQDPGNCRNAFFRLNRKYSAVLSQVHLTNKKYNALLRKVTLSNKAINKQLTNSQKELADLRHRLRKCEYQNQSENRETTGANLVTNSDLKTILRSSKRLAEKKATINSQMDVE